MSAGPDRRAAPRGTTWRRTWCLWLSLAVVSTLAATLTRADEAASPTRADEAASQADEPSPPVFATSSTVVRVDVVVRDGNGRPVRDLEASDFEVREDGRPQSIDTFEVVGHRHLLSPADVEVPARAAAPRGAPPVEAAEPDELDPAVIAFVFDRMSPSARVQANLAAMRYAQQGHVDGDIVGVFSINQALYTQQPFTLSIELVEAAFDAVRYGSDSAFATTREDARTKEAVQQLYETAMLRVQAGGGANVDAAAMAAIAASRNFAQIEASVARAFDRLERDQQGLATTNALLAVVQGLDVIPGRKTIVFLSEGMALPASVLSQFQAVIAAANRAQVSIYAIDAGGLRTESGTWETREEMAQAGERRMFQEMGGIEMSRGEPLTRGMERTEDFLRLNPEAGLGQLAEETGGFLVRDTNDAGAGFRRIAEDMRFYYVLSYTPTDTDYDGGFREISVRTTRRGVDVQSRKGYFAVRPDLSVPVRSYETVALAQLERPVLPTDFPFHATTLSFPETRRPGRVTVLASLPGTAIGYAEPGPGRPDHEADFCVVVRIRSAGGDEADRVSQRYLLSVPPANLAAARRGNVLFFQESDLPPGRYSVEAVAYDTMSGTASARTSNLVVPEAVAERPLRLSTVALIQSADKLPPAEQRSGNPLVYGDMMLYPNLGEPLRRTDGANMGFYFTAYGSDPYAAPLATIAILQGDLSLARVPMRLPVPDAMGRIQYAGTLPLQGLPTGDLTLRVSVSDGDATVSSETPFTLEAE